MCISRTLGCNGGLGQVEAGGPACRGLALPAGRVTGHAESSTPTRPPSAGTPLYASGSGSLCSTLTPPQTNTHSSLHRSLASEYLTTQMDPGLLHELGEGREGGSVEALGPRRAAAIATAPDYLAMTHQAQAVSSAVMVCRSGLELDVDDGVQWSDCCLRWAGLVCMMTFAGERNGSAGALVHETGRCLYCQNPVSHALPASAHPPCPFARLPWTGPAPTGGGRGGVCTVAPGVVAPAGGGRRQRSPHYPPGLPPGLAGCGAGRGGLQGGAGRPHDAHHVPEVG